MEEGLSRLSSEITSRLGLHVQQYPSFNKYLVIDFGSTNIRMSHIDDKAKPAIINNSENENHTPSAIFFDDSTNLIVGKFAKENLVQKPERVVYKIHNHINNPEYLFHFRDLYFNTQEIYSYLLKKIKIDAERSLGISIRNVAITVPDYFGSNEKKAIQNAAKIAEMKSQLIPEAHAAVFSLGRDNIQKDQVYLIYDLGGCSLDVNIVEVKNNTIETICSRYDKRIGGQEWDKAIIDYILPIIEKKTGSSCESILSSTQTLNQLFLNAEQTKIELSQSKRSSFTVKYAGKVFEKKITQKLFNTITEQLLRKTIDLTQNVIDEMQQKNGLSVDRILVVGAASQMPQVMEKLQKTFHEYDIHFKEPDKAIALGAALYADENFNQTESVSKEELMSQQISSIKNSMHQSFESISDKLEGITRKFQSKIQYDVSKQNMIDKLHAELQQYKDGLVYQILRPIVMDIIHLYDDMGKMIRDSQTKNDVNDQLIESLLNYQETIEDLLYDYGFEAYETDNEEFDPKRQHIIKTIPTSNPEKSRKIQERLRKGFIYEDIVVRREFVKTYLFNNKE